jgi:uncharacterized protein YdhG (YjbR/CyaY superfamily)/3-methyladenine DNA glycosylase AlkD
MTRKTDKPEKLTAKRFLERLKAQASRTEAKTSLRYFKSDAGQYGEGDQFIGVRMGQVFALAKEFIEMPIDEIERLLESPIHEARAGAVSIMAQRSKRKKTSDESRKQLVDLYLRRHDRINNWDLVDLGALYVVGIYLVDHPRNVLYKLAGSKNLWERRTAIVSTGQLIRRGEIADTFKIAEHLLNDNEDLIHKATGWMLRAAGDVDQKRLFAFLDKYAPTMPRTCLRYALEHVDKKRREHYMGLKSARSSDKKAMAAKASRQNPRNVDDYLSVLPKAQRAVLERLRLTVKSMFPDVSEVISYQIPTFKLNNRMLVSYAAFAEHCSFFPGAGPIETHCNELKRYQTSKGTIRFTPEHPLPDALVKKLVRTRVTLNDNASKKRRQAR